MKRKEADFAFEAMLNHLLFPSGEQLTKQEKEFVRTVGKNWIEEFLDIEGSGDDRLGHLKSIYSQKHFSPKEIRELLSEPTEGLPDLTLKIPEC